MKEKKNLNLISLFSGSGGLDKGFENAGFKIKWANEFDKKIWETFEKNFNKTTLDRRSIIDIKNSDIPNDCIGIIGGPPCQSWSLAGSMRGINDKRGKVFYEYIRVLKDKKPEFFLAENVPGIISNSHINEFRKIIKKFEEIGYTVNYQKLRAIEYGIPQERERVFIIGLRNDLGKKFIFPTQTHGGIFGEYVKQRDVIGDLPEPIPAKEKNKTNGKLTGIPNHEYFIGEFSPRFKSRNRYKSWDEPAYTIEASGRHAKLHPSSTPMVKICKDKWKFILEKPKFRRLSVRESARIQGFPDDFIFYYDNVNDGYKMIGNAVPVKLATILATEIKKYL